MLRNVDSGIREGFACGIRNSGKVCLRNLTTNDWNLESKYYLQKLESST